MNSDMTLTILGAVPDGLLSLPATELYKVLDGPTLIHLEGRHKPAVFFSVLLHGNEHTSWEAVRQLLIGYQDKTLPRSISLFIGNVQAARYSQRYVEGQQDFNRMWGDTETPAEPVMQQVINAMIARGIFLSVDIHNNTGKNPHYACVNSTESNFLYLANLFSRTIVYFIKPESVQSMAFSKLCPAVTIECGLSGDKKGTEHVLEFITGCIHLSEFPKTSTAIKDVIVYHTVAIAKIPKKYSLGFDNKNCDINLDSEIEYFNFRELPKGSILGKVESSVASPIAIVNEFGDTVESEYIQIEDGMIKTKQQIIPAMITLDIGVIRKDCLCYLMEEYPL